MWQEGESLTHILHEAVNTVGTGCKLWTSIFKTISPWNWAHTRLLLEQVSDLTRTWTVLPKGTVRVHSEERLGCCTNLDRDRASNGSSAPTIFHLPRGSCPCTPCTCATPFSTKFWKNFLHYVTARGNLTPNNTCTQWVPKWGSHKEPAALY